MPDLAALLRTHPLFATLDPADLRAVVSAARERSYPKGAGIAQYGDIWPYLFVVTQGKIEALKISPEGRYLLVGSFTPRDVFWGPAFFQAEAPMPVLLEASQASKIQLWTRVALQPVILKHGSFSWELARLMVTHMLRASSIVEGLAFQPVAARVAAFLLEQYPDDGETVAGLPRSLTLEEMAARTGTTREMVCRVLQRFAGDGAIEITRTEFTLVDRKKLENLTGKG